MHALPQGSLQTHERHPVVSYSIVINVDSDTSEDWRSRRSTPAMECQSLGWPKACRNQIRPPFSRSPSAYRIEKHKCHVRKGRIAVHASWFRWTSKRNRGGFVAKSSTVPVVECVFLLRAKDEAPPGAAETAVDHIWSLQYMIPHVLCASAGPLVGCIKGVGKLSEAFNFTHAVHMRFSSADHVTRFLADQVFLPKTMKQVVEPLCDRLSVVAFEGRVENDVMQLFRRGDQFEGGLDCFTLFSQADESGTAMADEMVATMGQIAISAMAGATQVATGRTLSLEAREGIETLGPKQGITHGISARFGAAQQVKAFQECPPMQAAIKGQMALPAMCTATLHFDTVPVENSRETAPGEDAQGPWWTPES